MNIGIDFEKFQQRDSVQVMTNYTKMPNAIIDDCIMAQISDKAFKCLMFVMRQTVGFNRASHTIATTQFQKYCGIKKEETVVKAVRELEQCKLITVERKTGCLNSYTLTINQYHETVLPSSKGATPIEQGYTTHTEGGSIKEKLKENFKEIYPLESEQKKSSVDDVLNLWVPNLSSLNAWLQRAGEKAMSQDEVNHWLVEINAHYEPRIKVGLVSENQMYSNFVKWVKRNHKKPKHSQHPEKPQSAKQQRDDAWAEYYAKRNQQQPNNIIDVVEVKHV